MFALVLRVNTTPLCPVAALKVLQRDIESCQVCPVSNKTLTNPEETGAATECLVAVWMFGTRHKNIISA